MKTLIKLIVILSALGGVIPNLIFSQEKTEVGPLQKKIEFPMSKQATNYKTVYFHIAGLQDSTHAKRVIKKLKADPNVYSARIYIDTEKKYRCQLNLKNDVDGVYIRELLLSEKVDYEFDSLIKVNDAEILKNIPKK